MPEKQVTIQFINKYLTKKDAILGQIIAQNPLKAVFEHPKSESLPNLFTVLLKSILSQQLSTKAAATIVGRFLKLFENEQHITPLELLNIEVEEMRLVGISYQKAGYLHNVANFWEQKKLHDCNWQLLDEQAIIQLLTEIKGVGKWTVEMILIFALQRHNVFSVGDLGIQNAMKKAYNLQSSGKILHKEMNEIAEQWQPYCSVACLYLWQSMDTKNNK